MGPNRLNKLVIIAIAVIFISIYFVANIHTHADGKSHNECQLCQYSNSLLSMQIECPFTLLNNLKFIIKINQENIERIHYIAIHRLVVRPPPILG
jgi:hypothetical protein